MYKVHLSEVKSSGRKKKKSPSQHARCADLRQNKVSPQSAFSWALKPIHPTRQTEPPRPS